MHISVLAGGSQRTDVKICFVSSMRFSKSMIITFESLNDTTYEASSRMYMHMTSYGSWDIFTNVKRIYSSFIHFWSVKFLKWYGIRKQIHSCLPILFYSCLRSTASVSSVSQNHFHAITQFKNVQAWSPQSSWEIFCVWHSARRREGNVMSEVNAARETNACLVQNLKSNEGLFHLFNTKSYRLSGIFHEENITMMRGYRTSGILPMR